MADAQHLPFQDPISQRRVYLVLSPSGFHGVEHGTCDTLADVVVELDAFFCPACHCSGRLSGAWAVDKLEEARSA